MTPRSWRIAALAVLVGGLGAGDRAAGGGRTRWLVGLAAGLVASWVGPLVVASRRPPIPPGSPPLDAAAPPPTITVLVGARDEAPVIERLVRDVAAQNHREADGRPRFELLIVDDRSGDGTGEIVQRAAEAAGIGGVTRVIRREGAGLADGKGAALTAAPPDLCRCDVVLVLDADARIGPTFLETVAGYVAAGAAAVTSRRRILHAGESALAGAQADEQTADGLIQRGRWALGGCSEFRGNGMAVRRDLLASVGGWRAEALTEDLDLSSRLAAGPAVTVAWALDAEVAEEPAREFGALWRQRVRWAEGAIRRSLEFGPAVLRNPELAPRARLDFAAYAGQLAVPPILAGVVLGAVRRRRPVAAVVLGGTYLAAGAAIAFDALRWEQAPGGGPLLTRERARRAVRVAVFDTIWLAAIPAALWRLAVRRGPIRYDKMSHGDAGAAPTGT